MRIPGFERRIDSARTVPKAPGDRFFPQLESYCSRECRAVCDYNDGFGSRERSECYDSCMEECR